MAQHDMNIANQGFPAFRSDLNNALSAINSSHSGSSTPSGAVAGTIWLDTTNATNPTLKFYDGADNISLATIDYSANTVDWLDSSITITGLSTSATGTVLTLSDSNILFAKKGYFAEQTLTDGATIDWNLSTQQVAKVTLAGNRTLNAPTNQQAGAFYSLAIIQEREAIGVYEVQVDNTNKKDEAYYINTDISYSYADGVVTASYGTATPKPLDDVLFVEGDEIPSDKAVGDVNLMAIWQKSTS
jgi:hypothetical protein